MATNKPLQSFVITDSTTTSVTFSNIDQTYTDLMLVSNIQTVGNATPTIQYNGNASGIYSETTMYGSGATSTVASGTATASQIDLTSWAQYVPTSGSFNTSVMHIFNYSNATTFKTALIRSAQSNDARINSSCWRSTDAITSLKITSASAFNPGTTFDLYGIKSGAPKAFGGDVVATDGNYWYHAFKASGIFTPQYPISADVLVVAGGGGGDGGGGGAGGVYYSSGQSLTPANYTATIGAGGTGAVLTSTSGVNSQFGSLTAAVGGGHSGRGTGAYPPADGGSGGGGANTGGKTYGVGTSGQGNNGGLGGWPTGGLYVGGGGGGAGAVGSNNSGAAGGGGGGGVNTYSSWLSVVGLGVSGYIAGGGGGGTGLAGQSGTSGGAGGSGGGGAGAKTTATAGTSNTGGGGGGADTTPGNGGSGLVIVRYAV